MRKGKTKSWKKKEKKEHTDNSMSCGVCRSSCSRINIAPRASFSLVMVENPPPEGASTASVNFTQREWSVSLKVEETRCMSSFVVVS